MTMEDLKTEAKATVVVTEETQRLAKQLRMDTQPSTKAVNATVESKIQIELSQIDAELEHDHELDDEQVQLQQSSRAKKFSVKPQPLPVSCF